MKRNYKFALLILLCIATFVWTIVLLQDCNIAVLNPKGVIATRQRDLIITATLLMLLVVVPVFILTAFISWKYREGNSKAEYTPEWSHSNLAESIWWGFPFVIIIVLSIVTWKATHDLDPFKPIDSNKRAMTVQVIALQWKWLFIYPEQKIASVNFVQFPENTPIRFEITSDAPMNSFWIPQLGGQIYAMPGMRSHIYLIADQIGDFSGSSANLSGRGFAGMLFTAKSTSQADFNSWIETVRESPNHLNASEYTELSKPSENNPVELYVLEDEDIFDHSIMKYMTPM